MKPIYAVLIILFIALQYLLWWGDGGIHALKTLKSSARQAEKDQVKMHKENDALIKKIQHLKADKDAIESLAREEYNMVQKEETYFQIIER